jgi:hypothetical protein
MTQAERRLAPKRSARDRFLAKVDFNGPVPVHVPHLGPCWEWTAFKQRGYGRFVSEACASQLAHVQAHWLFVGPVPDGHVVMHLCDNPSCVRWAHLKTGTHRDNVADRDAKGRQRCRSGDDHWARQRPGDVLRGERHYQGKLNEDAVRDIRERLARGELKKAIAALHGVTRQMVHRIQNGLAWKHVA